MSEKITSYIMDLSHVDPDYGEMYDVLVYPHNVELLGRIDAGERGLILPASNGRDIQNAFYLNMVGLIHYNEKDRHASITNLGSIVLGSWR